MVEKKQTRKNNEKRKTEQFYSGSKTLFNRIKSKQNCCKTKYNETKQNTTKKFEIKNYNLIDIYKTTFRNQDQNSVT